MSCTHLFRREYLTLYVASLYSCFLMRASFIDCFSTHFKYPERRKKQNTKIYTFSIKFFIIWPKILRFKSQTSRKSFFFSKEKKTTNRLANNHPMRTTISFSHTSSISLPHSHCPPSRGMTEIAASRKNLSTGTWSVSWLQRIEIALKTIFTPTGEPGGPRSSSHSS